MKNRVSPNKKVHIVLRNDITRKSSIIFDNRLGFMVLNKVENVPVLNELI